MTSGPNYKWISNETKSFFNLVLVLSVNIFFNYFFFLIKESSFLLNLILFFLFI